MHDLIKVISEILRTLAAGFSIYFALSKLLRKIGKSLKNRRTAPAKKPSN